MVGLVPFRRLRGVTRSPTDVGPQPILGTAAGNPGEESRTPCATSTGTAMGTCCSSRVEAKLPCVEVRVLLTHVLCCWALGHRDVPAPLGRAGSRPPSCRTLPGCSGMLAGAVPPCAPSPAGGMEGDAVPRVGVSECGVKSSRRSPALGQTHCAAFPSAETRCRETGSAHPRRATCGETEAPTGEVTHPALWPFKCPALIR